jgi:hypothetical protein
MINIRRTFAAAALCGAAMLLPTSAALAESYDTPDTGISIDNSKLTAGGTFKVSASGFGPLTEVSVYIYSDPVFLGSLTADSTGRIDGEFNVPEGLAPGAHTIELTGVDAAGDPLVLTLEVLVEDETTSESAVTGALLVPLLLGGGVAAGAGVTAMRFSRRRAGV